MKDSDEVYTEVKEFIAAHLHLSTQKIEPQSEVVNLTNDSIQLFELLIAFEKHYELEVAYEDVMNLNTVKDIGHYVHVHKYQG